MVEDTDIDFDAHEGLVDEVLRDEYSDQTSWEVSPMKLAIKAVSHGTSRNKAAENYDFSTRTLGGIVATVAERIKAEHAREEAERGISRDPIEEAADDIEAYLEYLNEDFTLGIKDKFIAVARRDVEMKERLPHPGTLGDMLAHYDSGIGRDSGDIGFIVDDYAGWLDKYQTDDEGWSGRSSAGGIQVGQGNQGQRARSTEGGVPVGHPHRGGVYGGGYGGGGLGQPPPQEHPAPSWVRDLRTQQRAVTDTLEDVADALENGGAGHGAGGLVPVEIEGEDGTTRTFHLPPNHPQVMQALGGHGGADDFLSQLVKAREAGLLDSGESEVAAAVQAGLEEVGKAQQQTSSQFRQAIEHVAETLADESETEALTAEKVDAIIEDRLTEDEQDRLRAEIQALREEVRSQPDAPFVIGGEGGTPLMQDADVMKRHVDRQAERDQLNTVQHAGDKVVDKVVPELRRGLRDIGVMMAYGQPPTGENAPGGGGPMADLYTPPDQREAGEPAAAESPVESLAPEDVAPEPTESDDVADLWAAVTGGEP